MTEKHPKMLSSHAEDRELCHIISYHIIQFSLVQFNLVLWDYFIVLNCVLYNISDGIIQ